MVYEIKRYGEEVLKQIAKEVELNEINDEFRKFLDDMVETMYETDGVGLAAPQVGVSKRVLIKYLNENGEEVEEIAENFLAVVVQHENDHLDGILFVEKISPMAKRLIAKKLANIKKETKRIKEENE